MPYSWQTIHKAFYMVGVPQHHPKSVHLSVLQKAVAAHLEMGACGEPSASATKFENLKTCRNLYRRCAFDASALVLQPR